ncbi:hypothetical protein G195_008591 [Phytophthora kernoviae 00238/432]|uniref:Uncharacterized protein n=1 Tax=Phytophthora kernoviae 00238/432 TaxID=1284355 RepID=A0A8J4RXZ3_9STRA|nr:hypothetical protein G195_008591 [Phytophthora kernoviae 00238/432]
MDDLLPNLHRPGVRMLLPGISWPIFFSERQLILFFVRSQEECAKRMASALANPEYAGGWKLLGPDVTAIPKTTYHSDELMITVWNHTMQTIERSNKKE